MAVDPGDYWRWPSPEAAEAIDAAEAERGRRLLDAEARHIGEDGGRHHRVPLDGDDLLATLDGAEACRRLFVEFRPV